MEFVFTCDYSFVTKAGTVSLRKGQVVEGDPADNDLLAAAVRRGVAVLVAPAAEYVEPEAADEPVEPEVQSDDPAPEFRSRRGG